jgi:hypothetical protein
MMDPTRPQSGDRKLSRNWKVRRCSKCRMVIERPARMQFGDGTARGIVREWCRCGEELPLPEYVEHGDSEGAI